MAPQELVEYLFCACAFFNLILAFFSDRPIPPPTPFIHPVCASDGLDLDLVTSDDKAMKSGNVGTKDAKAPKPTSVSLGIMIGKIEKKCGLEVFIEKLSDLWLMERMGNSSGLVQVKG